MPLKIAMIGAGSVGFTRCLLRDILAVPELQAMQFAFMDISARNLEMVTQLCQRDIDANGLPATVESALDQRAAITNADYIICTIRQGGLEAFQLDIDIPLKYDIDQCVGDTICAGGTMYAQRTIPVLLDICRDIREVAHPGALFLNYANPMRMNTWACNQTDNTLVTQPQWLPQYAAEIPQAAARQCQRRRQSGHDKVLTHHTAC